MFRRIAVAISGGVDSAVSALLLKERGLRVVGIYMKNWDILDEVGYCTGSKDVEHARLVCDRLKIPFHQVDFVQEYWNHVFIDFIEDYQNGLTPNPDMLCNKFIKFDMLLSYAVNELGVDAIATGHYANNSFGPYLEKFDAHCKPKLLMALDRRKDQTFFLSQINNEALKRTLFPLAMLKKNQVKEIACQNSLKEIANKKESQGICFIGPRHFQKFISEYVLPVKGNFIDIDSGKLVGTHNGIHQWTIGQRCRIGGLRQAYYVVKKTQSGDIFVASGHDHPLLYSSIIITSCPHWIHKEPETLKTPLGFFCNMRFQHGKPMTKCNIKRLPDGCLEVTLKHPLRALAPGQYSVFYKNDECLGSARILKILDERFDETRAENSCVI